MRCDGAGSCATAYEITAGGQALTLQGTAREGGEFQLGPDMFAIVKQRRKQFLLSSANGTHADADLARTRHWTISSGAGTFDLVKPRLFREQWQLSQHGQLIGELRRRGAFTLTVDATIPDDVVPLPLQLFALHLVTVLWHRQSAGAAAASSG